MDINFIGCTDAGGASTAIDAAPASAHPMSSLYFVANNQGNNMTHKQIFSTAYSNTLKIHQETPNNGVTKMKQKCHIFLLK